MEINLLWLMLPSVGLVAYVQFAYKHYDDRIRDVKKDVDKAKEDIREMLNTSSENISRVLCLPEDYQSIYDKIKNERSGRGIQLSAKKSQEKYNLIDVSARISKFLICFVGFIVVFQYFFLALPDIFLIFPDVAILAYLLTNFIIVKQLALFILVLSFFSLFIYSLIRITEKRKEWVDILTLLDSYLHPYIEKENRLKRIKENSASNNTS